MVQKRKDDLSLEPLTFEQWRLNNSSGNGNDDGAASSSSSEKTTSYRRVTLQGTFDHTNSILIGPRGPPPGALATTGPNSGMGGGGGMSSSMQGYFVVTPLIVAEENQSTKSTNADGSDSLSNSTDDASSGKGEEKKKGWLLGRLLPWRSRNNTNASSLTLDEQHSSDIETSSDTKSTTSTISSSNNNNNNKATIVWINRGWIPRHYINQNSNQILQSWDEPKEHVTLLSMESQTEKGGGMFTPPSRLDDAVKGKGGGVNGSKRNGADSTTTSSNYIGKKSVKKLLWMDREAMEEIMTNCNADDHPPLFVQINTTTTTTIDNNTNDMTKSEHTKSFPVQPNEEYVGEFKVTPEVHMGYAVTWFGLSGAGVLMTRKLLTRGR
jgi:cytochrome oxidase assembly protein ShyY1